MNNNELYHYGVKGMRWGHRKVEYSGGISGMIRRKQMSNAKNDLNKVTQQRRSVDAELKELKGFDRNPSRLGKSKISTAIRRYQIKSLENKRNSLNAKAKENTDALKELKAIDKYANEKRAKKESAKKQKKATTSQINNRDTAIKALDKLENMAFFSNNKNSFAISSAIGDAKRKIENGESYANAALEALDTYNFYKD